jgi:hypothetical protein
MIVIVNNKFKIHKHNKNFGTKLNRKFKKATNSDKKIAQL